MAYGHAERNLALIRQLEAETRQLLESLDQPDPEQSAAGGSGMPEPVLAWPGRYVRSAGGDGVNGRVRENDWEDDVQQPLVTLALEVRTVNDAGSPDRSLARRSRVPSSTWLSMSTIRRCAFR